VSAESDSYGKEFRNSAGRRDAGKVPLMNEKRLRKRRPVRAGRPPRELAGEVDDRILEAARHVFLERGLGAASIDEIARRARAGKPTVYARFTNKEALFSAVVMRNVAKALERFAGHVPAGATLDERLTGLGAAVLDWALALNTVGLMRASIAEARRFPDLASSVHRMARERGEALVGRLLVEAAQPDALDALPAFAPEHLATTARLFMDLVFFPLILRALFGEEPAVLRDEIRPHVARSVKFFLAACRHGGVD
jgi:AcrR family transcriptional regulator